ncbi:expressed unknown protein [Seminavis robusta]|uniref:Uncharacterized protein n=1 Tax=Seminavis robusta TaxID=568900 RepID=A0A9N8H3D4_9STRA|nr:expressed unknown protein [Seminavis robusta]|eukprot:Sro85_g045200.1 n/a (440) ;mRNA; f:25130-26554
MVDESEKSDKFDDEPSNTAAYDGGPPQRQHKYSTADMKPENPWKKICCTILTCLVCIAIMILISLLMQKLFDPDEDEDWTDDAVNATDDDIVGTPGALSGAAAALPKNMAFIEDVCSEARLGEDDVAACESACAPAKDCCNPYSDGGNSTCFEAEQTGCFAYSKCHSLNGFFDAAHNDLDRVCSKASLEINPEECKLACSSLSCCYLQQESCVAKHFESCLDYAPCQNLKENSIDVAPMDLDERCEKSSPTCKRDCKDALCCSDPNSKCFRDNFVACLSYSACTGHSDTKIIVAPIYSRVTPAPATLEDVCSPKGIAEYGSDRCQTACNPGACCWLDGAAGCFGDDPLGCMEFERCTILKDPNYAADVPVSPTRSTTPSPVASESSPEPSPEGTTSAPAPEPSAGGTPATPAPTAGSTKEATPQPTAGGSESAGRKIRG